MYGVKSANDGSLQALRDRISYLEYALKKEREKRKSNEEMILQRLDALMAWHNGDRKFGMWRQNGKSGFASIKFSRDPIILVEDEEDEKLA